MSFRKLLAVAALSAALVSPAFAQAGLSVGRQVTDTSGGAVGTITAVNGDQVTLRTDRHEVALPASSFTATEESVLIGVTQAQLNAQVDQILAQQQQAFTVGAMVYGRDGAAIGPVESLDGDNVVVSFAEQRVQLPRSAFAARPEGGLVIGATLADLQAQLAAAQGGAQNAAE